LGIESSGQVTIVSGVRAGEEVVTSAQFLIDSESKLRETTAKMMESLNEADAEDESPAAPQLIDHSNMIMNEDDNSGMNREHSTMGKDQNHD